MEDKKLYDILFDEIPSDEEEEDEDEEGDPDFEIDDDLEDEFDANPPQPPTTRSRSSLLPEKFSGKNKHEWFDGPLTRTGRAAPISNIHYVPFARGSAATANTLLECWEALFDQPMLRKIVLHTQQRIDKMKETITTELSYHRATSIMEIRALIGLLYFAGVLKSSKLSADELWETKYGLTIFHATMSKRRFQFLLSCLRFDDEITRTTRQYTDNFAPIRELWNRFIKNCTSSYSPHTNLTIDEQLLNFRGNCPFKVYMPSKPAKYGIKIYMMNDAKTYYMINALPYIGKSQKEKEEEKKKKEEKEKREKAEEAKKKREEKKKREVEKKKREERKKKQDRSKSRERETGSRKKKEGTMVAVIPLVDPQPSAAPKKEPVSSGYVKELSRPFHGTRRNITVDNYFSSILLFDDMLRENITMVGTLRKNKPEIPPVFLERKTTGSSLFAFDSTKSLVSYSQTEKRNVLLLSTCGLFYNKDINLETLKPEVISFYNRTKTGTDTFDLLCSTYTVARQTRRWPLRLFYGMLDQAGYNAQILYLHPDPRVQQRESIIRRKFLKDLAVELIKPLLRHRLGIPEVRRSIKNSIRLLLDEKDNDCYDESYNWPESAWKLPTPARCQLCARKEDTKTTQKCVCCGRPICPKHRSKLCVECAK